MPMHRHDVSRSTRYDRKRSTPSRSCRSHEEYDGVYFGAIGGAGALLAKCIKKAELIAYEDLGAEALRKLYVEDMPLVVIIDSEGNNLYEEGRKEYLKEHKPE